MPIKSKTNKVSQIDIKKYPENEIILLKDKRPQCCLIFPLAQLSELSTFFLLKSHSCLCINTIWCIIYKVYFISIQ